MRSKLFVPASRPELFEKAARSEADAISFDLEDAVDEARKHEARAVLSAHLEAPRTHDKLVLVRVNALATEHFKQDVEAIVRTGLDVINLPKIESPEEILAALSLIELCEARHGITEPIRILANIETPAGLQNASASAAAHPRVMGLQIGFGDLFAPLGIRQSNSFAIAQTRWSVRIAAAQAGIDAFDGAFVNISAPDDFVADAQAARAMGFTGKSCIHPSQLRLANEGFRPTPDELAHAVDVTRAAADAGARAVGAFVVNGQLVDGPFITRAQRIVEQARRDGLLVD